MNAYTTYIVPTAFALLFHAIVIGALMYNWTPPQTLEVSKVEPYFIEATAVKENPLKVREAKKNAQTAARDRARREAAERQRIVDRDARLKAAALEKAKAEQASKEAEEREKAARQPADESVVETDTGAEQSDEESEEARLRMESELAMAIMDEQVARRAVTDDEKAMAFAAQIRKEIVQNWSRPPSARNGMEALLKVSLVPTGEVIDVKVMRSSGNESFDRSAVVAVEKSERFLVPNDPRQFERNFREFEVLFRPEDLRL